MGTHGIGMTSARTHARMVDRLRAAIVHTMNEMP